MAADESLTSPVVGDFTDTAAWTGETEISASEVVEKQQLVK
jgi:hypothetical protein